MTDFPVGERQPRVQEDLVKVGNRVEGGRNKTVCSCFSFPLFFLLFFFFSPPPLAAAKREAGGAAAGPGPTWPPTCEARPGTRRVEVLQLFVSDRRHGWWPAPNPNVTYKWIGKIACDIYSSRTSGAAFYLSSCQT